MKRLLLVSFLFGAFAARGAQKETARLEKEAVVVDVDSIFGTHGDAVAKYEYGQSRAALMVVGDAVCRVGDDSAMRRTIEARLLGLLARPGITPAAREFVVRQLSFVGGSASVPALAKDLGGGDANAAALACFALERIPDEPAGAALRSALIGAKGLRQAAIATALGNRRDAAAVDTLAGLLAAKSADISGAAARALARIGGREAVRALGEAWGTSTTRPAELTDALLTACGSLGPQEARATGVVVVCRKVYAEAAGAWQKLGALRALLEADRKAGGELLKGALVDEDTQVSAGAARLLAEMPGEEATRLAVSRLGAMDVAGRAAMLRVLRGREDRSAASGVRPYLDAEEESVRVAAYEAIGALGDKQDVARLVGELPYAPAADALETLKGDGVGEAVAAAFARSRGEMRVALVKIVRGRGEPSAAPALMAALSDADPAVAREAVRAMGELGGKSEMAAFVKRLNLDIEPATLRTGIEGAVAAIAARLGDEGGASAPVLKALRDVSPVGRASLVRVLGRLGEEAGLEAVADAANARLPTAKDAGVRTLAAWPGEAALKPLLAVARSTRDLTHHVLAMRGYIRLLKGVGDRSPLELKALYDAGKSVARRDEEKSALTFEVKGAVIRDLTVKSEGKYRVHFGGLREGAIWSSDREYTFVKVPHEVRGATYIESVMDDRSAGGSGFLSFVVDEPVVVYVGFDNRCRALPAWLRSWERLKESIHPTRKTGCHLVLHRKRFEKGKITLGGADAPGVAAMYCVAVKESK